MKAFLFNPRTNKEIEITAKDMFLDGRLGIVGKNATDVPVYCAFLTWDKSTDPPSKPVLTDDVKKMSLYLNTSDPYRAGIERYVSDYGKDGIDVNGEIFHRVKSFVVHDRDKVFLGKHNADRGCVLEFRFSQRLIEKLRATGR